MDQAKSPDASDDDAVKDLAHEVHRLHKGAAQELEVSLSTMDRMIHKGELEVVRDGGWAYVDLAGPRYRVAGNCRSGPR